ncbi:NAD-dependent epimerase/dehydratase family protein [Actinomadura fulvescens]|uniref:NAD-dependent epimerase/dehydratase domain-containing protein n=1 Tax=Actinomadura fulvescens TaxID=46160 RepID=A0ABP6CM79_9ACTN
MEIIGTGFLAHHLQPLRDAHPGYLVLAAGVPRQQLPDRDHRREAALVDDMIERGLRQRRTLVFFSTASMYGAPGCRGLEDDPIVPSTRYGAHKRDLELRIRESGVDHLILRLSYVLGPNGPDFRLVPALMKQILSGRVRILRGARRDMLHVSDFVAVLDRLFGAGVTNDILNVASGDCAEILHVVEHLERRLGVAPEHQIIEGSHVSHCPSVDKLRTLLPEFGEMGLGPGYHRHALSRYLAETGHLSRTA